MKYILAALAMIASLVAFSAPAQAETCALGVCKGGWVYHASDGGYDPDIIVFCNWGEAFKQYPDGHVEVQLQWDKAKYIAEGVKSTAKCGVDTDVVYVRANEEVWCNDPYQGYVKTFDAKGPHKINDLWNRACVLHTD